MCDLKYQNSTKHNDYSRTEKGKSFKYISFMSRNAYNIKCNTYTANKIKS